ncbi:MAG TPA: hypothetical protein PLL69_11755 [Gemmatimonadales bacterium]|nr:hypothetical protein [Gemmatimonadales bacterium]
MIPHVITRAAAIMLVAAATVPESLHAQFRLPRLRDVAAKVNPTAGARVGVVQFDEHVLEITAERLAMLKRGLAAEQEMARRVDAQDPDAHQRDRNAADQRYRREREAYDAAVARHDQCSQRASADRRRELAALEPSEAELKQIEAAAERLKKAHQAGDMAEVMRLTDSLAQAGNRIGQAAAVASNKAMEQASSACGPRPVPPSRNSDNPRLLTYEDITRAGHEAAGLQSRAYRILRERVAPLVLGQSSGGLVYQPGELSAINAAMGDLKPFADLLQRY